MGAIWFWLVALMLALYIVLDGFDLGVGILHLLVPRTSLERGTFLRTIGPVWDGNEVWLVAAGGTLYFAFPLLYASAFSGFYLPLMIVLWLLILRGIAVELRMHFDLGIWQDFFDGLFSLASALLAIFFGAALANVIRGVPIGPDNYFFLPLWTNFRPGPNPGILDWYTVLGGLFAITALAEHGALYLALKTEDPLRQRARAAAKMLWLPLIALTILSLAATIFVRRQTLANYVTHPLGLIFPAAVATGLGMMLFFTLRENDAKSFAGSTIYLAGMLLGAAFALYPALLPSTVDPANDITVPKALAGHYGVSIGLIWWGFGMALAVAYFVFLYWIFRGRIRTSPQPGH
jgi:cytochrome d ubiquinol oxidase subunit II